MNRLLLRKVAIALLLGLCTAASAQSTKPAMQTIGNSLEVARLIGVQEPVVTVSVSADGKIAAAGDLVGVVCTWDVLAGKSIHAMHAHKKTAKCVAITPDGKRVVSGGNDGLICIWEVASGELISKVECGFIIRSVAISADGKFAAGADESGEVHVINVEKDHEFGQISYEDELVMAMAMSENGSRIAVSHVKKSWQGRSYGPGEGMVTLRKTADGSLLQDIDWIKAAYMLRFVDHDKQLQWISANDSFGCLDTQTFKLIKSTKIEVQHPDSTADMPADSSYALIGTHQDHAEMLKPDDKHPQHRRLPGNTSAGGTSDAVAVSADGNIVLIGGRGRIATFDEGFKGNHSGSIIVLNLAKVVKPTAGQIDFKPKAGQQIHVSVIPDGSIYVVHEENKTQFYDPKKAEYVPEADPRRSAPSLDGTLTGDRQQFLTKGGNGVSIRQMVEDKKKKSVFTPMVYDQDDAIIAVSPDNHWFAIGRDVGHGLHLRAKPKSIQADTQLFDLTTNTRMPDLATGPTPLTGICFSADSKRVAITLSALDDHPELEKSLQIWDVAGNKLQTKVVLQGRVNSPHWSKRDVIACISGRDIKRWDANTGKPLQPILLKDDITDISFSPDGSRLLVSEGGGALKLLNAETGDVLKAIQIADVDGANVQYLTDGSAIAIGHHQDGSVTVFPLDLPK